MFDQSLNEYFYEGFGNHDEDIQIVERMNIYNLVSISDGESTEDTMDFDGICN